MDTLNYCDFSIICRICLSKSGKKIITDAAILDIIHKLTDLDFETDDLPQKICQKCFKKINDICEFSFQCKRSHSALIECLNQQRIHEPNVEIVYIKSCNDISDDYDNHIIEDEVKNEASTNSEIFVNLVKTEELKEEILDLESDVVSDEDEVEEKKSTNSEINDSLDKCSTTFIGKPHLTPHKHLHNDGRPNKSTQCPKTLTHQSNLVQHEDSPYKCDQCPLAFKRQQYLAVHKRKHSGERPYKCDQCSKTFIQHTNLIQHKRTHSGERRYKCGQCSKTYTQKTSLRQHERMHSGERPYKCGQCTKTFARQWSLVEHENGHKSERTFKCDQCPKTFKRFSSLYVHKDTHSDNSPYECDQCLKKFTSKYILNKHIKTHNTTSIK